MFIGGESFNTVYGVFLGWREKPGGNRAGREAVSAWEAESEKVFSTISLSGRKGANG